MFRKPNKYYALLTILIALYVVAIFVIPPDPQVLAKYQLTAAQLRLLSLTVYIPYIIIWVIAFYGFIRFKQYTQVIKESPDGRPLEKLANGHMLLAFSLPLSALSSALTNYIERRSPDWMAEATILENYIALAVTLAGFILISRGAAELVATINKKPRIAHGQVWTVGFAALAAAYSYVILHSPVRQFSTGAGQEAVFYLPDSLIILTIILPYIYIWYLGMRSAAHIDLYKKHVRGHIYKPFLGSLAAGIAWVIAASILLQFFTALSDLVGVLALRSLLVLIYLLLIFISVGYIKIALGAKQLKKIEEV